MINEEMIKVFDLSGQVALVTGGGSGLGYAMAACLAAAGARVIIAGRHKDILDDASEKLGKLVTGKVFDVTRTEDAPKLVEEIVKQYGSLDILINNAGVHCKKSIEDVTMGDLQNVMNVHVFGAYALTQAVIPYMKERKNGSIIFISSMSAIIGLTNVTAYSAAKAALLGLINSLSGDVAAYGIRVNAIVPGFIDTPMFHKATDKDLDRQKKILNHTPMGSYGLPEDIGWAAVYLAGNGSRFVTGMALRVDGGCAIGF